MAELADAQDLGSCAERRVGSIPTFRKLCGCIAQRTEHRTLNPQVEGSSPSTPILKFAIYCQSWILFDFGFFFLCKGELSSPLRASFPRNSLSSALFSALFRLLGEPAHKMRR